MSSKSLVEKPNRFSESIACCMCSNSRIFPIPIGLYFTVNGRLFVSFVMCTRSTNRVCRKSFCTIGKNCCSWFIRNNLAISGGTSSGPTRKRSVSIEKYILGLKCATGLSELLGSLAFFALDLVSSAFRVVICRFEYYFKYMMETKGHY